MLWQFREDAFVPHALLNAEDAPADCPVSIGWHPEPGHHHDVIINLSPELPAFFSRFERLVEVVVQNDDVLDYTRQHFRFLKDRGYPIEHKDMRMR
jgi:DNA polymerase-3 subunit chi